MTTAPGQVERVRDTQHRAGVGRGERLQTDPVGQVRLQAAQLALLQPLRGQQQVHLQRATQPADRHEQLGELRLGGEQLGELVRHDQQGRQGSEVSAALARLLVVAHVGEVAGIAKHLLAAHHLTGDRILHPVHEGEVVTEVGDHR